MKQVLVISAVFMSVLLAGCSDWGNHSRGVFMLADTSGTYKQEVAKAGSIVNYLLGTLHPGDSMSVARIDSGSFSEKDIIHKATFDRRPSVANMQKLAFKKKFDEFAENARGSSHTDITGGVLQAIQFLNEAGPANKNIIIFSDLEEDLTKGHVRDFPLEGVSIEASTNLRFKLSTSISESCCPARTDP